ncbi:NUDIX hydrolase [Vibrio salinus]|uniref:NUDIX hydrolase n=1 Tax=Vibrio salinus TaxID=2899784 RepID=UPI001E347141|nr:NUDIX domain-containing protein [Vibrio salinus]MCE0494168.1 NUDIX domain-containing protein [Vibrio salinus]
MNKDIKKLNSVAWIFQQGETLLCVKSKGKEKYFIPGGKLENGETNEAALLREIKEELGIDLLPDSIRFQFDITDQAYGLQDTHLTMSCYTADFSGELMPDSEIETADFLGLSQLDLCAPAAQQTLQKVLKSE